MVTISASLLPVRANAFFEDLCADGKGGWKNCVDKCDPDATACTARSAFQAAQITPQTAARSMYHIDSTYHIAMRLGFRADVAYWLAAYDEAADTGEYTPMDECGALMNDEPEYKAINKLRGLSRADANGGTAWHISTAFATTSATGDAGAAAAWTEHKRANVSGYYPYGKTFPNGGASWSTFAKPASDKYEGILIDARRWALPVEAAAPLCAAGFTTLTSGSYFMGTSCLSPSVTITGTLPPTNTQASTGPAALDTECDAAGCPPALPKIVHYAPELESLLTKEEGATGVLFMDPAKPLVPLAIARMGIYLHFLQDRPSHATYCSDLKGSYTQRLSNGNIQTNFNANCGAGPHAITHMMEYGTESVNLPLRSYQALSLTFDELVFFAKFIADFSWFDTNNTSNNGGKTAKAMTNSELSSLKGAVVGRIAKNCTETPGGPDQFDSGTDADVSGDDNTSECWIAGTASGPHKKANPADRVAAWKRNNNSYNIAPMPGWTRNYKCSK